MLNNKQRELLSNSLIKMAEYVLLTLVIGQIALGKVNIILLVYSVIMAGIIYLWSLFILRESAGGV